MEMRQQLVKDRAEGREEGYFIERYNEVIETYNEGVRSGTQYLETMRVNPFFRKVHYKLARKWVQVAMIIVLALVPLVNVCWLGFLWFYYFNLHREAQVHRRNTRKCKNPLQSFYFLPEICRHLGKHCAQMTICTQDLEGFTFNQELYEVLKAKHGHQPQISVIIYDQYFYDGFHLFKKEKYKMSAWIFVAILLIVANILILGSIFQWY